MRVGDLARPLEVGVDHADQIDVRQPGQDPRVMPPKVPDADDRRPAVAPGALDRARPPRRPTMAMPAASAASITAWPSTSSALPASTDSAVAPTSRNTSMVRTPMTGTSKRMS